MAKLIIKAEKELTELERFGFERVNGYYVLFGNNKYEKIIEVFDSREIFIDVQIYEDRFYLSYVDDKSFEKIISVLFDLIQADLVEKVEEGE